MNIFCSSKEFLSFVEPAVDELEDSSETESLVDSLEETPTTPIVYGTKRRYLYDLGRLKASLTNSSYEPLPSKKIQAKECSVCFDFVSTENMVAVPGCHHEFCNACLAAYIKHYLDEHPRSLSHEVVMAERVSHSVLNLLISEVFGVCCPHRGCRYLLDIPFVHNICKKVGDDALFNYFEEQTFLSYVDQYVRKEFPSCPLCNGLSLPCSNAATSSHKNWSTPIGKVSVEFAPQLECLACGYIFCCACRTLHHGKCFFLGSSRTNFQQLGYLKYLTAKNCRICPSCQTPIEKNGGCDHMVCHKCQTHFNWSTAVKASQKANEFRKLLTPQEWTRVQRLLREFHSN